MKALKFNDETIQRLFGFEDAESEPIDRLREYYFKKNTFDRVTAELPIRILMGLQKASEYMALRDIHHAGLFLLAIPSQTL